MAVRTYVLVETQVGKTKEVVQAIHRLEGVVLVNSVSGPYDVIAVIERENLCEIGDLVTAKFHLISGISRTMICVAVET